MKKILYIHNAMQALPGFSFPGIQDYATRALTNSGGIAVIPSGLSEIDDILSYYHSLGLGVDGIVCLPADERGDLYPAVRELNAAAAVKRLVSDGYAIEFFNTREWIEERLIDDLGLNWRTHVVSLPSAIAGMGNDKACVRLVAKHLGLNGLFPPHRIANDGASLASAFHEMARKYGEVVIKPPSWASGLGMVFGSDERALTRFLHAYNGNLVNIIVERSFGKSHVSMTIVKRFINGIEVDSWITAQDCPLNGGSVAHVGSVLGDIPHVSESDAAWMQSATAPLYQYFLSHEPGLTGIINWDCLKTEHSERFVLEGNFRTTFSTYLRSIQLALSAARGTLATCIMSKVQPRNAIRSFADLKRSLGNLLLQTPVATGSIPIVVPCLPRNGYCYFVAVGNSYADATSTLKKAITRIS